MAYGNRKGPEEMGPKTGRAMGFCAGYSVAGYQNGNNDVQGKGIGRGKGTGRGGAMRRGCGRSAGRGLGMRRGFGEVSYNQQIKTTNEVSNSDYNMLIDKINELASQQDTIQKKLEELSKR